MPVRPLPIFFQGCNYFLPVGVGYFCYFFNQVHAGCKIKFISRWRLSIFRLLLAIMGCLQRSVLPSQKLYSSNLLAPGKSPLRSLSSILSLLNFGKGEPFCSYTLAQKSSVNAPSKNSFFREGKGSSILFKRAQKFFFSISTASILIRSSSNKNNKTINPSFTTGRK